MTLFLFDFDSTLVDLESLDFAAHRALEDAPDCEARLAEIERLTAAGMEGRMDYGESLSRRVALAGLSRAVVESAARDIAARVRAETAALLDALRDAGARTHVVSGGLRPLLAPAAERLGAPEAAVHCNEPVWTGDVITAVDRGAPLSRQGGKAETARQLRARLGPARIVMVGDGATDLEARAEGAADWMIGYGGVARREAVRRGADAFADDLPALRAACLAAL